MAAMLFASLSTELNSQPKPNPAGQKQPTIEERFQLLKQKNTLLLEQQSKTLQALDSLQKEVELVRKFSKRV